MSSLYLLELMSALWAQPVIVQDSPQRQCPGELVVKLRAGQMIVENRRGHACRIESRAGPETGEITRFIESQSWSGAKREAEGRILDAGALMEREPKKINHFIQFA